MNQPRNPASTRLEKFFQFFAPPLPIEPIRGTPEEMKVLTRQWQMRILVSTMVGYALFYFVRKNLSFAMPGLSKDLGITKSDLGWFLTVHGVIYGVSRFFNGWLADRTNARSFMTVGLVLAALMNFGFGFSSTVVALGVFWMLNGWVQGMGFPPCARLMTHWFPPKVLASRMAVWNTSHSIGAGLIAILCGYLAQKLGWRWCFFVPAGLALLGSIYLWKTLCDTPPSVGLPEAEGTEGSAAPVNESAREHREFLMRAVFRNRYVWLFALANFFVYIVRYGILDWGPTLLKEMKHYELSGASWMVAAFEISGVVGMLVSGWLTDRVFGGRGGRTCVFYMAMAGLSIFLFWQMPPGSWVLDTALLCLGGFFIYGPQALIGIAVANLATKRAAATAAGFTGIFGYASTVVSGLGLGYLVQHHGWNAGFELIVGASIFGTLLFLAAWSAKAHGYAEPTVKA